MSARVFAAGLLLLLLRATAAAEEATPAPDSTTAAAEATPEPTAAQAEDAGGPAPQPTPDRAFVFEAYWEDGIQYRLRQAIRVGGLLMPEASLGAVKLTGNIGLRLAVDTAGYFRTSQLPDFNGGIDVRRFFVYTDGRFEYFYPVFFSLEFGIVESGFYFNEGTLWLEDLPYVGRLQVGQFKAPFALDTLASSRDLTFMEQASPLEALAPGTKAGIMVANTAFDRRLTWAAGWFADGQQTDVGDASQSLSRLVARVTGLPLAGDEPDDPLVHLGFSASYVYSGHADIRYQSRPESFLAPELVDTGPLDAANAFLYDIEGAWRQGPLSVQGEFVQSLVDTRDFGLRDFYGTYISVSDFLTGEQRPYNRNRGIFGQVEPLQGFDPLQGHWGAVEVAGRYSLVDLSDGPIQGGRMRILSGGLNWYWSRFVRWDFEYAFAHVDEEPASGNLNTFQMRCQVYF